MADQITIEQVLELVDFELRSEGWQVKHVKGNVCGDVYSNVLGNVEGDVEGDVYGDVYGEVGGTVRTTINGRKWQFIETPKGKLKRLIQEGADKAQLLEAFNQLEDSND